MGAYLSTPNTEKITFDEESSILKCGHGSMQGWRLAQEDAHNCLLSYDENSSLFSVYDGHGGAEVATYCSLNFPDHLKKYEIKTNADLQKALKDAFLSFDATLLEKDALEQLKVLAGLNPVEGDMCHDYDVEDNISDLREEAQMPLNEVLEKYRDSKLKPFLENLKVNQSIGIPSGSAALGSIFASGSGTNGGSALDAPGGSGTSGSSGSSSTSSRRGCGASSSTVASSSASGSASGPSQQVENDNGNVGSSSSKTQTLDSEDATVSSSSCSSKIDLINKDEPTSSTTECEIPDSSSSTKIDTSISDENTITEGNGESKTCNTNNKTNGNVSESSSSTKNADGDNDMEISTNNKVTLDKVAENVTSSSSMASASASNSVKPENGEVSSNSSNSGPEPLQKKSPNNITSSNEVNYDDSTSDDDDEDDEDVSFNNEEGSSNSDDGDEEGDIEGEEEDSEEEEADDEEDEEVNLEDEAFMNAMSSEPGFRSGCTAVVALLRDHDLYVANAGDSRCVLCRNGKPIEMSLDHKPEDQIEFDRIKLAGGRVTVDGRVNGGLNLSRAIGDHGYKTNKALPAEDQMISAMPDVKKITLTSEDEFMILACDGIWNFMTSEEVVLFVKKRLADKTKKISKICEELFDHCLAPHSNGDGTGCDNMTAIIVQFQPALFGNNNSDGTRKRAASPEAPVIEEVIKKQKVLDENVTVALAEGIPEIIADAKTESDQIAADTSST